MWTPDPLSRVINNSTNFASQFSPQLSNSFLSYSFGPTAQPIQCSVCHYFESVHSDDRMLYCFNCGKYFHQHCGVSGCDLHCAEWKEFQVTFDEIFENSVTSAPFLIENETLGQETTIHNLSLEQREYNNNCDNGTPGNNAFNVNMSKSVISEPSESELNNERTESNLYFLESETSGQSQSRETNPLQNCSNTNTTTSKDPMNIMTNKSNNNNNNTRKKRIRRSLPKKCTHDQTTPRPLQTCPTPEMMLKIKSMLQRKRMKQKTLASLLRVSESTVSKYLHGAQRTTGWTSFEQRLQHIIDLYIE